MQPLPTTASFVYFLLIYLPIDVSHRFPSNYCSLHISHYITSILPTINTFHTTLLLHNLDTDIYNFEYNFFKLLEIGLIR